MPIIARSSGSPWRSKVIEIAAGATEVIDTFDLAVFTTLEYHMSMLGTTKSASLTAKYNNENNSISSQVYGKLGKLKYTLSDAIGASALSISITNNEAFAITVSLARLKQ